MHGHRTFKRLLIWSLCGLAALALSASALSAQKPILRVGVILDGPWERNQQNRLTFELTIQRSLASDYEVVFPPEKLLNGDWTISSVAAALDQLMSDPDVDYVLTLGLLGSNLAARRGPLRKPLIAPYVIEPDLLQIPYRTKDGRRVSGVANLSYLSVPSRDISRDVALFQQISPFQRLTVVAFQGLDELFPNLEGTLKDRLSPLGVDIHLIFAGGSLEPVLGAIPDNAEAVLLTPLPQLSPAGFDRLVEALQERRLPSFMLGAQNEVAAGLLAGMAVRRESQRLAERTASHLAFIASGGNASDLPVDIEPDERLLINQRTAQALGLTLTDEVTRRANAPQAAPGLSDRSPSMSGLADVGRDAPERPAAEQELKRRAELSERVRKALLRLPSFGAFDSLSFSLAEGSRVVLLGYVHRPSLKRDAGRTVGRLKGVETLENRIEVLPNSTIDDRIRLRAYAAIYGHPSLRRYAPGGGITRFDVEQTLRELRFGLGAASLPSGPHPIHILVRHGHVALVGTVSRKQDRQIAELQVRQLGGVFSVENYIQVAQGK